MKKYPLQIKMICQTTLKYSENLKITVLYLMIFEKVQEKKSMFFEAMTIINNKTYLKLLFTTIKK